MRAVIALGGNAMTARDGSARPDDQRLAVEGAMLHVAAIVASGHQVVLTHGNGPQVGNLLVKNEMAAAVVPPVPLDWCGAQTQGTIGTLILNALGRCGVSRVAALVSRTLVDAADAGVPVVDDGHGGYRGVEAVIDKDLTAALLARTLAADALIIATDVEAAMLGWGTPVARALGDVDVAELR